ncbi:unnamed protein product [Ectocarpus sp. CCAP 1310/34]|nr:unnamed protein product [Ectocarpus sp. CCAP 1310/34]
MAREKPASGADVGWSPHRLPSFVGEHGHLVDPCDSREDPIVCAALVKANVYIDLEDVFEAEREFWKNTGVSIKVEDLRHRVQLVLADFRDVLLTMFTDYSERESGLERLAVAPATNPAKLNAEEANGSKKKLLAEDGAAADEEESQASTSDDNGSVTSGSTNNSASAVAMALEQASADCDCDGRLLEAITVRTTDDLLSASLGGLQRIPGSEGVDTAFIIPPGAPPSAPSFQASIPTTSVAASPFPGLRALEECPTRLERASSPARIERIRAAGVSPVWSVGAREGDEAEPFGGGTGLGTHGERALVEKLSMSGAQFLDFVDNCEVLEGRFSWAAGASVIHRVTREGRNRKTARSIEILGCPGAHGGVDTSPKTKNSDMEVSGRNTTRRCRPSSAASGNPRRPQTKRGEQAPHKGRGGHRSGESPTKGGVAAAEASGQSGAAMGDRVRGDGSDKSGGAAAAAATGTTSKSRNNTSDCQAGVNQQNEIGKLHEMPKKPAQDGLGGGEDIETESLSKEAAFLKVTGDTEGGQGGMLFPEFVEALTRLCLKRYAPWVAPRNQGPGPSASSSASAAAAAARPRAPQENQLVSVGLPLAHHRLRFAFEQHLLPEADREISDIMECKSWLSIR